MTNKFAAMTVAACEVCAGRMWFMVPRCLGDPGLFVGSRERSECAWQQKGEGTVCREAWQCDWTSRDEADLRILSGRKV